MLHFILGGARSGKSSLAERLARQTGLRLVYIATGTAGDSEMTARIEHHQQRRGDEWLLVEEPLMLAQALENHAAEDCCILLDCLTLWTTNLLYHENPDLWKEQRQIFLRSLSALPGQVIIVSNEVGQGIIPLGAETRRFVDEIGFLHQEVAALCDRVSFVTAGLEQRLK